jgi:nucleoid DNA-binding protein
MANKEHVKILKQGVEVWNKWREENPGVRPDLSGTDLEYAMLTEADLSGADLTRIRFHWADLFGANFRGANLSGADLLGANLFGANLRGADLTRTKNLTCGQLESAMWVATTVLPNGLRLSEGKRKTPEIQKEPLHTLTKAGLVKILSEKTTLSTTQAKRCVDVFFGRIVESMIQSARAEIRGFGVWEVREMAARSARNPGTGERIFVPRRRKVVFRPGKALRVALSRSAGDSQEPE